MPVGQAAADAFEGLAHVRDPAGVVVVTETVLGDVERCLRGLGREPQRDLERLRPVLVSHRRHDLDAFFGPEHRRSSSMRVREYACTPTKSSPRAPLRGTAPRATAGRGRASSSSPGGHHQSPIATQMPSGKSPRPPLITSYARRCARDEVVVDGHVRADVVLAGRAGTRRRRNPSARGCSAR